VAPLFYILFAQFDMRLILKKAVGGVRAFGAYLNEQIFTNQIFAKGFYL
jgi:hypothetical protein